MVDLRNGICGFELVEGVQQSSAELTPFFGTIAVECMVAKTQVFVLISASIDDGKC